MEFSNTDRKFMLRAYAKAIEGISAGQAPFGAVIVRDGAIVSEAYNTVWGTCDPTAHAEVNCIRSAATALLSINLSGCTMFTTCEPCPMCLAAIHWSKIDRVVFGAVIADAAAAGFHELHVDARALAEMGRSPLRVESGLLREECARLFEQWRIVGLSNSY